MDYVNISLQLYDAFFDSQTINSVDDESIINAIERMKEAYKPKANRIYSGSELASLVDYNNFCFQFAYLHKYARIHTAVACDVLQLIFRDNWVFKNFASKTQYNLCSLGGGPGTDVFALLFALGEAFGNFDCKIDVIDSAGGWKFVFERLLVRMYLKFYDKDRPVPSWTKDYRYLSADLLSLSDAISPEVYSAIINADVLTMIKFLSSINLEKARSMLKAIFCLMKQDSVLLFIDNAAGGFHELLASVAEECRDWGIESMFGPVKNYMFADPRFAIAFRGYVSQAKTRVTFHLLRKVNATRHLVQIVSPKISTCVQPKPER